MKVWKGYVKKKYGLSDHNFFSLNPAEKKVDIFLFTYIVDRGWVKKSLLAQNLAYSYVHLKKSVKKSGFFFRIFFFYFFLDFFLDIFLDIFFPFYYIKKSGFFFGFFFRFFFLDKNIQKKSRFFYVVKMEKNIQKNIQKKSRKKYPKKSGFFFSDFFGHFFITR